MSLLYNIFDKQKEKMAQTVRFSSRRYVPFFVWIGEAVCLIRAPVWGRICIEGVFVLAGGAQENSVEGDRNVFVNKKSPCRTGLNLRVSC